MQKLRQHTKHKGEGIAFGIYDDDTPVGFSETGEIDGEEAIAVLKL